MSILIAIIVFGAVVLVHELGHYLAARRCGIWVEEFAIGMGTKLVGKKIGDTLYTIRVLPLGGYCKMYGDDADVTGDKNGAVNPYAAFPKREDAAFNRKTIPQRMLVMVAGSLMNFVLAFVIFLVSVSITGFRNTTVYDLLPDMPAEQAGIIPGDKIVSVNGTRTFLYEDILFELSTGGGKTVDVGLIRDGVKQTVTVTPYHTEEGYKIGFYADVRAGLFDNLEGIKSANIFEAAQVAFFRIGFYIKTTVLSVVRLVTAQLGIKEMTGIIGIVGMIDDTYQSAVEAKVGFGLIVLNLANFCAVLSANLGVLNLLPLPALDGGRMVFLGIEAIRRKPVSAEREGMVHLVGFVLLIILAVYIAYNDIMKML